MKLSGFLKYDASKKKISLIAISKYSGLNKKINHMYNVMHIAKPKISEHDKQAVNKLFYNSVFGIPADNTDFSSLYPSGPSLNLARYPFKKIKIKKVSESIQLENYKFSKQDTIKRKKLSRVAKTQYVKLKLISHILEFTKVKNSY